MTSVLSAQQRSALSNLLDVNAAMHATNARITTGKSVNSIFDNPTKFLLSGRLNDRADNLLSVNKGIDFAMTAVNAAQKALAKLKTDLTAATSDLKTLRGLSEATAGTTYNPTNVTIQGAGKTAAGESGTVSGSGTLSLAGKISAAAIQANKRVFGAGATNASNTADGTFNNTLATGTTGLRININVGGTNGQGFAAAQTTSLDITAADVGDGTGNLQNLTLADVVRKINADNGTVLNNVGANNRVKADLNANGALVLSVVDKTTGAAPATAQNFRVQIGSRTATTAAGVVATDFNGGFGLTAITGNGSQVAAGSFTSTLAPSASEAATAPPSIVAKVANDSTRAIFDTDADATNNGIGFNANTGAITTGNFGIPSANTLSFAVKSAGGATTYLNVTSGDLASNTLAGLVSALNSKAATAGLTGFSFAIDPASKQLTMTGALGTSVSIGMGATAAAAQTQADLGSSSAAFGFAASATFAGNAATFAADASAISMLGNSIDSFQEGDTFKITVNNSTNPADTREVFFQAASAGNVPSSYIGVSGSKTQPYQFNTMQQLAAAISTAFGTNQLSAAATKVVGTGTGTIATQFQLSLSLNAGYAMDIEQVANAAGGMALTPNGADVNGIPFVKNAANALEAIFGQKNDTVAGGIKTSIGAETLLLTQDIKDASGKVVGHEQDYAKKISYTRIAAAQAGNGDPKRTAVSTSVTTVLSQIAGVVTDSQIAGQPNLLSGKALVVNLSEKSDRSMTIQLSQAVTTDGLGFTAATGGATGFALFQGLGTDADVDNALAAVNKAISSLDALSYNLGSQGASIVNWQSYNKDMASLLTSAATDMVTSDSTADSVEMQALSLRTTLGTQSMGLLNQAAQGAAQLLR